MKKILLIITIIFCIFQMVVLAVDIDVGSLAIDRGNYFTEGYTFMDKNNPANASGKITSVKIWANETDMTGVIVAIFTQVDTNIFTARDSEAVADITAGSEVTRTVELEVVEGDFIGVYWTGGRIELDWSGDGMWYKIGDHTSCIDTSFGFIPDRTLSLYGTGTTEVGWPHKWNTLTIGKWNTKEFTKWNGLE